MSKTQQTNRVGEYVPAIPEPYHGFTYVCACGKRFFTKKRYREHFALDHILDLD